MSDRPLARAILKLIHAAYVFILANAEYYSDCLNERANKLNRGRPPWHKYKDYDHPREDEQRSAEQFAWRAQGNIARGTLFAAIFAAVFTGGTWLETSEQAADSHQTLILSERPFVYVNPPQIVPNSDHKTGGYEITTHIGNSGNTQTEGLRTFSVCKIATNYSQVDYAQGMSGAHKVHFVLGPKADINTQVCPIAPAIAEHVETTSATILVIEEAIYHDVVTRKNFHVTESCYVIHLAKSSNNSALETGDPCPDHNCADDECPDYEQLSHSLAPG